MDDDRVPAKDMLSPDHWADLIKTQGFGRLMAKLSKGAYSFHKHFNGPGLEPLSETMGVIKPGDFFSSLLENYMAKSNYLLISPPEPANRILKNPESTTKYKEFNYRMWSHKDHQVDSAGYHAPFDFIFTLPETAANELEEAIRQNPDLIEEIFQTTYPDTNKPDVLSEKGVQRVKVNQLKIPDTTNKSGFQKLDFSTSVGEVAFE